MVNDTPVAGQGPLHAQCEQRKRTPASEGAAVSSAHARSGEGKRIGECIQTMCTLDHRFCRAAIRQPCLRQDMGPTGI